MEDDPAAATEPEAPARPSVGRHRAALAVTALVVITVLASLPFAVRSMVVQLFGSQQDALYDLNTDQEVPPVVAAVEGSHGHYYNVAVVDVSETTGSVTLAISGNRECPGFCPAVTIVMFALDDNASQRRGLPPSATIVLEPDDLVFSESATLPIRGRPNLYPFDFYDLWLGFAVQAKDAAGNPLDFEAERLREGFVITLQNQDNGLVMTPPRRIDPASVAAVTDPGMLPLVQAIRFDRPDYLKVLSVLLVLLIAASGGIALATRSIDDLLLGVGGLILGVWGIRSVLVNQPLPGISAVDLALTLVILFLLLGLAIRLTLHFHRHSELRLPRLPQRVKP
jgi:hypothetical protein